MHRNQRRRHRIETFCLLTAILSAWIGIGMASAQMRSESAPGVSAPPASEELNAILETIREKHNLPALAGAIIQADGTVMLGAVGRRVADREAAVTIEDRWHLGSNTKAMTATLIGLLVEEGKLHWNATLADGFPELADRMHADWRAVTVEQLLSHHGGAPADLNADGLWLRLWQRRGTPEEQRRVLLEGVLTKPPAAEPGTKYIYSNAGYAIAGALAERVAGRPWEELMQARLFSPLGITTAGFGAPGDADQVDQPWGHRPSNDKHIPVPPGPFADNPPAIGPAGTVHMSLGDYAKFIALHLDSAAGAGGEARLLRRETFAKLHADAGDGYALGWGVTQRDWGGTVLSHAGSNTMWYCVARLAPEKGFAVVVATNLGGPVAEKSCNEAAETLIRKAIEKDK